jgi:Calx-beta domain/Bacterial Ig domain
VDARLRPFKALALSTLLVTVSAPPLLAGAERGVDWRSGAGGFEASAGPAGSGVAFVSRGAGHMVSLTREGASVVLLGRSAPLARFGMRLAAVRSSAALTGVDPLPGLIYESRHGAIGPLQGHAAFQRVHAPGVYDGIDLVYYRQDRELEFDFVVAPHADPHQIRLAFSGVESMWVGADGELSLAVGGRHVLLKPPSVYQEDKGSRQSVAGRYLVAGRGAREVTFEIGRYDASRPLVIDPTFLIGSSDDDVLVGFEANALGEAYLLGTAPSGSGYPATAEEPGSTDDVCFLTKLDATGAVPLYSILFSDTELCGSLAVAGSGTAYFAGYELPLTPGLQVTTIVAVDDSSGTPTVRRIPVDNYSQFSGPVSALALDAQENVYLVGPCRSVDAGTPPLVLNGFNTLPNAGAALPVPVCQPGSPNATVLSRVDGVTGAITYATFLTPDDLDSGGPGRYALAVDAVGHAYLAARYSASLATTADADQASCTSFASFGCAYLMVVDTNQGGAASLTYASYLWDLSSSEGFALRLDPGGSLLIAMDGSSSTFPETLPVSPYPPFPQPPVNQGNVVKRGIKLARLDVGPTGAPSVLRYGLIYSAHPQASGERVSDLRLLPSGAVAVASLSLDLPAAVTPWAGSIDVFYPSGQMRAASEAVAIPDNDDGDDPNFLLATDAAGDVLYATNDLQAPAPAVPVWDLATDRFLSQDPGANTPPFMQTSGDQTVRTADPNGTMVGVTVSAFDAEDGPLTADCTPAVAFYVFPVGVTHVECLTADSEGLTALAAFDITVQLNTLPVPAGDPPPLQPPDLLFGAPTTVSFHGVAPPGGEVSLVITGYPRALPAGVRPIIPSWVYDLETTAVFDSVDVCLAQYVKARDLNQLHLYLLLNGTWSDVGASLTVTPPIFDSTASVQLCVSGLTALGPFAIVEPEDPNEVIVTVAGNTSAGYNGDGIPGTSASVASPLASVADALGDLYIADYLNDRVRRVSSGVISTLASIARPTTLALEASGSLLVASAGSCQIQRVTPQGGVASVAGTACLGLPASPDGTLAASANLGSNILGLAVDSHGNVFFTDHAESRVRRIAAGPDGVVDGNDPAETLSTVAGTGTAGYSGDGGKASGAQLSSPRQIAVDRFDNLFIADGDNYRVRRVGAGQDNVVSGPPVPDDGSADDELIATVVGTGPLGPSSCSSAGEGGPATAAGLCLVQSVAFDAAGNLLVGENYVRRVSANAAGAIVGGPDELIRVVAGTSRPGFAPNGDGSPLSVNLIPTSLSVDPNGNVYISDAINNLVRRYGPLNVPAPAVVTIADAAPIAEGDYGSSLASFTVTVSGLPQGGSVDVDYATSDDSAAAGEDYTTASGTLTLTGDAPTATITVAVLGDTDLELDERFFVTLSIPTGGAVLGRAQAVGTILDDDLPNRPPVASDSSLVLRHDRSGVVSPIAVDLDDDPLVFRVSVPPAHGTLTPLANGRDLLYTPAFHFVGTDEFRFVASDGAMDSNAATVTLTVTNAVPVLTDRTFFTRHDHGVFVPLGAVDPDGDPLVYALVALPTHGFATLAPPQIAYIPDALYVGPDAFQYLASDGIADSDTATVAIAVTNRAPVANDKAISLQHDMNTDVDLTGSDADADPLIFQVAVPPAHGTLTPVPQGPLVVRYRYTAEAHYAGPDEFRYVANDGVQDSALATVSVTVRNVAPTATSASFVTDQNTPVELQLQGFDFDGDPLTYRVDTDPSHGALEAFIGNRIRYTPEPGYSGHDSFRYRVNDGVVDSLAPLVDLLVNPISTLGVTLAWPNGGEKLFANTPASARWTFSGEAASFDLELSRDGGASFAPIPGCTNLPPLTTSCAFTPGGPVSTAARLRISVHDAGAGQAEDASDGDFTLSGGAPMLRVLSPNGNANWPVGSTQTITWAHNLGSTAFVRLELSRDAGLTWSLLVAAVQSTGDTAGAFSWSVTGPTTSEAFLRATWVDGPAITDVNNAPFEITAPTIRVTVPNTALSWRAGDTRTIRFTHGVGAGQAVALLVSRDGGGSWAPIGLMSTTTSSSGSFDWVVTGPATQHARIRAVAPGVQDDSDRDFTILPRVSVTSPRTAVTWAGGSAHTITWTHNLPPGQGVDIDARLLNGLLNGPWQRLASNVPNDTATGGSFTGPLPPTPTTRQASVRVSPRFQPTEGDESVLFTLTPPVVALITPNTPARWVIGQGRTVRFRHNLGTEESMRIELSRDSGVTWETLASNLANTSNTNGRFDWIVEGPPTTHARIRVVWTRDSAVAVASAVDFTIASQVTVTSPNSSVSWAAGSRRMIEWKHSLGNGQPFDVDLSLDGGVTWLPLFVGAQSPTPGAGSAAVTMPTTPAAQALVRVSPSGAPDRGDVSDVPFTLAPPFVLVTAPSTNVAWTIGSAHNIKWTHNLGPSEAVAIDLSRDDGATWIEVLAPSFAYSREVNGSWAWTVTGPATTTARLRARWSRDAAVEDLSDSVFRIR